SPIAPPSPFAPLAPNTPITTTAPHRSTARVVLHAPVVRPGSAADRPRGRPAGGAGRRPDEPLAAASTPRRSSRPGAGPLPGRLPLLVSRQITRPAPGR